MAGLRPDLNFSFFLVPVAVVVGVGRLMNYGVRVVRTLFPLIFIDQMG